MAFNDNQVLTTKQAAACLGWSMYWTRVRAQAGDIPYYRPGKRKMIFKAKDIAAFLGCKVEDL